MAPIRGTRSTRNQVTWTCKAGHINDPQEHLLFDMPCFECRCGCGEKFDNDFEFFMGDVKVNNHDVIGEPMHQEGATCVAFAYAKIMESTKRMKAIIEKKDPDLVPVMSAEDLVHKYEKLIGNDTSTGIKKVVHMAQILKDQGIRSEDKKTLYKVSDISTIRRDDCESIASALGKGFPLHAGLRVGKNLQKLKFCQIYKPPHGSQFIAQRIPVKGHAVVLIGAGRKKGRWYYFFLNSWRRFCVRKDSRGKLLRYGVGFSAI
ncbi:uncharacterized protein C2845_PM06G11420 [Panicum miliaceum]|uniref:Peptidase C1A papain C-terminal domain-containing protein n=1 Tax=Panicum miliaceum TaxID=4540 RepID=A0A3L6R7R0_PANMI|nr:uncharacterized protein C2845_PM06G11420 [Panicum miliaceum]